MVLRHLTIACLAVAIAASGAAGQAPSGIDLGGNLVPNGEAERYLRVLELTGHLRPHSVAIRPWSPYVVAQLENRGTHPWVSRFASADSLHRGVSGSLLRPALGATYNSSVPFGEGDGPVWLGRGVTVQAVAGIRASWGPVSAQVAPVAFWAQNAPFRLAPNGEAGDAALRDPRFPGQIDLPQRFGTGPYGRLDPGYSRLGVDTRWLSAGFSTSPLAWGPARDEPLVIGPGAGGFPHLFFGTGSPLPVFIGRLHAQLVAGRLEPSRWAPTPAGGRSRALSAAVVSFLPRGVPGLEVGFVRSQERLWAPGLFSAKELFRPFSSVLSLGSSRKVNRELENGYASAFFRWAAAPAGLEVYGEYGREDYAGNFRWLLEKPDDLGNLLLGFQRAFVSKAGRIVNVRGEIINAELSHNERGQRGFQNPFPPYTHSQLVQGHTLNGQLLGSPTAYGGAGWRLALDRYSASGRSTYQFERRLVRDWLPTGEEPPLVWYAGSWDRLAFRNGHARDLGMKAVLVWSMNGNPSAGGDQMQLQLVGSWHGW